MKAFASLVLVGLAVAACEKQKPAEGPAERAGKSVDETSQKANQDLRQMGDDVDAKTKKEKEEVKKKL